MLGLERLGAVRVPCEESWSADDVARCAVDARATTLIANRRYRAELDGVRDRMPAVERFIIVGEEHDQWARLDSLVTRAQPFAGIAMEAEAPSILARGVLYTQQALLDASIESAMRLGLVQTDRLWATFPAGTPEWIFNTSAAAWSCGAATVVHEGAFAPQERFELLRELEVTVLLQTPEEYAALLAFKGIAQVRLPRLRQCLCLADSQNVSAVQSLQTT
jgi:acyl-coenzyme A synthetase/AMP-(fatty) acid ligase